jgi:hypothetical protein
VESNKHQENVWDVFVVAMTEKTSYTSVFILLRMCSSWPKLLHLKSTSGPTRNIIGVSESKSIKEEIHLHGEKLM